MAFVITRLCRDCVDQSCVSVCPVDCILEFRGEDPNREFPDQLYIDPEECIDCGVCEPECPWEAIFEGEAVPDAFAEDIALNARILEKRSDFAVPEVADKVAPTVEQVRANKHKWGLDER
jgi:ferredoxin